MKKLVIGILTAITITSSTVPAMAYTRWQGTSNNCYSNRYCQTYYCNSYWGNYFNNNCNINSGNNQNNQNNSTIHKPQTPPQTDSSNQSFAAEVLNLVNKEREKAGVGKLTLDTNLSSAASIRGNEILKSFSHTRPDGRSFYTVLSDNGISYRGAAENIAKGQRTAEQVVNDWMNSEGHRKNILNPNYKNIGISAVKSGSGYAWVQLFTY